jgi:hypothetical protein
MKIQQRYWIATLSDGTTLRIPMPKRGRPFKQTTLDRRRSGIRSSGMRFGRSKPLRYRAATD